MHQDVRQVAIKRTMKRLALAALCMFGFAFAMVPFYSFICDTLGINGATRQVAYDYVPATQQVDESRTVKVEFVTNNNAMMPWDFRAAQFNMRVHPGEQRGAMFWVKNPTQAAMIGQAVPHVAPAQAARYFHKTECFCFDQQKLEAGEALDMPLRFVVDPDLPKHIHTITLSYTLFDVTQLFTAR